MATLSAVLPLEAIGDIRVAVRVRPPIAKNIDAGAKSVLTIDSHNRVSLPQPTTGPDKDRASSWTVTAVYPPQTTNEQLFRSEILPLVEQVVAGTNAHVVAYGATHSGKAYTMQGDEKSIHPVPGDDHKDHEHDHNGVVNKAADHLFDKVAAQKDKTKYLVTVSMWQIREASKEEVGNRKIRSSITDLLNPEPTRELLIYDHRGLGCMVEPLAEIVVKDAASLKELIRQGVRVRELLPARATDTHRMGKPSTVIDIRVEAKDIDKAFVIRQSLLRFIQAAGSGGQAGLRDYSLSTLVRIIGDLSTQQRLSAVSFHQSYLTRVMEAPLAGNTHSLFLMHTDPTDVKVSETRTTLELAQAVTRIKKPHAPRVNTSTINAALKEIRELIKEQTKKLKILEPGLPANPEWNKKEMEELSKLHKEMTRLKRLTWESKQTSSKEMELERRESLKKAGLSVVRQQDWLHDKATTKKYTDMLDDIMKKLSHVEVIDNDLAAQRQLQRARAEAKATAAAAAAEEDGGEVKESKADAKMAQRLKDSEKQLESAREKVDEAEQKYKQLIRDLVSKEQESQFNLASDSMHWLKEKHLHRIRGSLYDAEVKDPTNILSAQIEAVHKSRADDMAAISAALDAGQRDEANKLIDDLARSRAADGEKVRRLEFTRNRVWRGVLELHFRHEVELERYQEHMFFVFRQYRAHFEQQKNRMESRYREMLENAIQDALYLADQNASLKAQLERSSMPGSHDDPRASSHLTPASAHTTAGIPSRTASVNGRLDLM